MIEMNNEGGDKDEGASATGKSGSPDASPGLPQEAHDIIGRKLRETYKARLNDPIPDKFGKLLDQLAKGSRDK